MKKYEITNWTIWGYRLMETEKIEAVRATIYPLDKDKVYCIV